VDPSHYTDSAVDELSQIRIEARQSVSREDLRQCFERLQSLRRTHLEDFDLQLQIADVQEQIIERARQLEVPRNSFLAGEAPKHVPAQAALQDESSENAETSPEVPRIDTKTWQRATYLALFFTLIICAAFFYLIQTARRINMPQPEATAHATQPATNAKTAPAQNAASTQPPTPIRPTLRLYTDLVPGTVSIDEGPPQDLKDGELVLDTLQPGQHSIKVTGHSGDAAFSYDVSEKAAPRVVGLPSASNVMAVLISEEDGKGHLVTNAEHSEVSLDGKPAGEVGPDGLALDNLGKSDHDIQVTQAKDRQRFVLTYTPAPALTVYVKSDPNAGTVVVMAGQDGADVFVNDKPYRRKTDRGQVRIPLKVGQYMIRVHKAGFIDPPPETVEVKKAEETAVEFRLLPVPQIATLQIRGALPATMIYVDDELAAVTGPDGNTDISNVKPGEHIVELRREQALSKKFQRSFKTGDVIVLSGADVTLEKVVADTKPAPPPPPPPAVKPNYAMEIEGSQVRHGGGFVHYHVPRVAGHYSFAARGQVGGFLKHSKLQWYAGFQDSQNYILFTVDGKHASIREIRDGKQREVSRIPFSAESNEWVQVDLIVRPNLIDARLRTPDTGWDDIGTVESDGRDFTQNKVGFLIPGSDEITVSNFRFSNR